MRSASMTSGGVLRSLLACQNITKLKQQQPRKAVLRLPEEIAQLVRSQVVLMHLHRSAWALSWERRAPARLQKPRWSVALPAKALTQQILRKRTRLSHGRSEETQHMSLRAKLLFGYLLFIVALVALGGWSAWHLREMGD